MELTRLTEHQVLLQTAFIWAQRSTCSRLSVGAVLAINGRTLSTGYNGAPAGQEHCIHDEGATDPCKVAIHAEENAVLYAARAGRATHHAILYCTHAPCYDCSQQLLTAGIDAVFFAQHYRNVVGLQLLSANGVFVKQLDPGNSIYLPQKG